MLHSMSACPIPFCIQYDLKNVAKSTSTVITLPVIGLSMSKLDTHCQSCVGSFAHAKHSVVRVFLST